MSAAKPQLSPHVTISQHTACLASSAQTAGHIFPTPSAPASERIADMMAVQNILITSASTRLRAADEAHLATHSDDLTVFEVNSYVLVEYSTGPPTRLHTRWEGPYKVLSFHASEYTLLNLTNQKQRVVHASRLTTFIHDALTSNPADTARRDAMEFLSSPFSTTKAIHAGYRHSPSSSNGLVTMT